MTCDAQETVDLLQGRSQGQRQEGWMNTKEKWPYSRRNSKILLGMN